MRNAVNIFISTVIATVAGMIAQDWWNSLKIPQQSPQLSVTNVLCNRCGFTTAKVHTSHYCGRCGKEQ